VQRIASIPAGHGQQRRATPKSAEWNSQPKSDCKSEAGQKSTDPGYLYALQPSSKCDARLLSSGERFSPNRWPFTASILVP
jgi:hypothetical protein